MRKLISAALISLCLTTAMAQSGTNSPYSQYALGQLAEQSTGFNRGMNGLGLAFREHNQVNYLNPASYSAIDSLTFIFDMGMSMQVTNMKEGNTSLNANNSDFEYAVAAFRAMKHVGVSFGIVPFTNLGYSYATSSYIDDAKTTTAATTYSGEGGIREVYIGAGWEMFKGFSIGANLGYLWGETERSVVNSYSDSYVNTLSKYYTATVNSYKLDLGAQYTLKVSRRNRVTVGATYTAGHKLNANPQCLVISTNSVTSVSDTTTHTVSKGYEIPTSMSAGITWNYRNRLKVGADVNYQKWGDMQFPVYKVSNSVPSYALTDGYYSDRTKWTVGGEYCQNENSRRFMDRVRFRAGMSYASSYYKINGQDGPNELSVSAGFAIPIINAYNNRSMLNISCQWAHASAKDLMTENTFRINVGVTFNERWFMKWKFD